MKNPKFSVIIPAHNEEDVIERAVKSVQNQTFKDFEIIVSNDGSKDKTREIVEKMQKKDKRIKILNRPKGHSAAFARNRGAEVAKGEILVFLDADTLFNKEFLEEINKKSNKADAFMTLNYPLKENFMSWVLSAFVGKPIKEDLKDGKVYNKSTCDEAGKMFFVIKRKAYDKIKGYSETLFYYEDEEFADKFYKKNFKSVLVKGAKQYYELPSTFSEFMRQCKWLGKGTNSIQDKKKKKRHKTIWFLKFLFIVSPIFFIWDLTYFLAILILTILLTYIGLVKRNKKPFLSLIALPFLYIKTVMVTINIIRFWK